MPDILSPSFAATTQKFTSPSLPSTTLQRERLIAKLNEVVTPSSNVTEGTSSRCKLILLHSPAGYGKTTLLADFARQTPLRCCWYFLDQADTDKLTFLKNLLTSIQHCFPQFGPSLRSLLQMDAPISAAQADNEAYFEGFIESLIQAIQHEISQRFLIILCNYHEINKSKDINALIASFLQKLPSQCMLVIETRAIPEFELAQMIAYRELFGLGSTALQFTAQEIQELAAIQRMAPLGEEEARQLATSFNGWIAGLLLGTRLGDIQFLYANTHMPNAQALSMVETDKRHLFAYVVNEVFKREPSVYHFLKEACVLQQMTIPLCNDLLDISNAAEQLHYAEQQGLFVSHTGENADLTYSCHQVLRELLYHELRARSPQRFTALHQRAARLMYAQQLYDQAIFHALEGGLEDLAVQLLGETYKQLLLQGHIETLIRWLDLLPEQIKTTHPRILSIQASIAIHAADHELAQALLTTASTILAQSQEAEPDVQLATLQAEISLTRSKALYLAGFYLDAQTICQQVLALLPVDEIALRAEAYHIMGIYARHQGDLATSISYFHQALQTWGPRITNHYIAETQSLLASSYSHLGNFALAEHHITRALKYWNSIPDNRGYHSWGIVSNLIRFALIKLRQGLLTEADSVLNEALTIARNTSSSHPQHSVAFTRAQRGEAYALENLGEVYQEQGDYRRSLTVTEEALALARSLKDSLLIRDCLCSLALTYALMGDTTTARFLVSEIEAPATPAERAGYPHMLRDLTLGTILLLQPQYAEAAAHLSPVRTFLNQAGLQREYLQATLRLTACQLGVQQVAEAMQSLEDVEATLARHGDYEHVVQVELQRFPALSHLIQKHTQIPHLRELIHLKTSPVASAVPVSTDGPDLRIQAFGEPAVFLKGELITSWRRARTLELFFLLLDKGSPMRKEQIITALWPFEDEGTDQTLRVTVHYLRKAIGEECLLTRKGTYAINLAALYGDNTWYDVALFQDYHKQALAATKVSDEQAAKAAFSSMVELYRGDFVQSFYNDWCAARRDALRTAYLEARQHLAHLAWHEEEFEECILHWQHMLAIDNLLEEAHYGLMRCYLRQGKRGLALRQYQRCRDALMEELAVQPGPAIQNLYERLTTVPSMRADKKGSG
ncbi:MAG TPA: BTAD domain-containing putative transcriptional regulator [Ktedonobacteraceae bacterium]|nr:BTAD domain-containing putative transcriptional regulator [Ktedonobacteraceae bacterium]